METIRFVGHLFPRAALINVTLPELDWKWEEKDLSFRFRTIINNSTINVECSLDHYNNDYFNELFKRASDLARTAANLVCFATGEGVIAVFEFVILPDGTPSTLRFHDASLAQYVKSYRLSATPTADLSAIAEIVVKDPRLFRALNDLIEAITIPHMASVNCGRVIDSIRRQIAPTLDGTKAWEVMGKALNIARSYRELISKQSVGPRHGDGAFIPGPESVEVVKRTWIIMDRYLEYRKRGEVHLTLPEFPELV
jgi:hypothetical protein